MNRINKYKIIGDNLPNMPWEEREKGSSDVIWRYKANPIIPRGVVPNADSVYNSAVVPFEDGYAGVFRCDNKARNMTIRAGRSKDGINFDISGDPIEFKCDNPEIATMIESYDPRVVKIDDKYWIMWCNNYHGYTIGMGYTYDFKTFHQIENAFLPFNRNAVLFPRKINGKYLMFSRPSDSSHTPFGDIFISQSPNMVHWGEHRFVMGPKNDGMVNWQMTKVGAGPIPIETSEGWLMIYHGVLTTCNGFTYSMGAALLDLDEPWKVIHRSDSYLLAPHEYYECVGNTPNVVFPCAALTDAESGRIAIYYGAADSVTGLAFGHVDEIIDYISHN